VKAKEQLKYTELIEIKMIIMETTQMFLLVSVSICVCHTARQFVPLDPAHFGVCMLFLTKKLKNA
jgi:hypothetical protein